MCVPWRVRSQLLLSLCTRHSRLGCCGNVTCILTAGFYELYEIRTHVLKFILISFEGSYFLFVFMVKRKHLKKNFTKVPTLSYIRHKAHRFFFITSSFVILIFMATIMIKSNESRINTNINSIKYNAPEISTFFNPEN